MSLESPVSVIYSSEGYEISLSQSMTIGDSQPGLMVAGSSSLGARFIRMSDDGSVFITGSIASVAAGTQVVTGTVHIDNVFANITGSNGALLVNQGLSASNYFDAWKVVLTNASGSAIGLNSTTPMWITGTMTANILSVISASITGTVATRLDCAASTTVTGVLATVASYQVFATNNNRVGVSFYKTGGGTAYIKLGTAASSTSYTVQVTNNGYWELSYPYCGPITIIFNATTAGSVVATEVYY